MADIKVERRAMPGWMTAALLAVLVIAAFAIYNAWMRTDVAAPDRMGAIALNYEGHTWVPAGAAQAVSFPAEEMVAVGEREGRTLWANRVRGLGGGGGGGQAPAWLQTGAYHRIYVKLDDGRFMPLVWRDAVPAVR